MYRHLELPMVFIILLGASFIFSIAINVILLKFAETLGIRNQNNQSQVRWNPKAKPSLGGISFYLSFLLSFIFLNTFLELKSSFETEVQLIGILITCSIAFLMGLADDAYNTKPLLKFLTQFICALVLLYTGTKITWFHNDFYNYTLTILWVVGLMNSINMLDNMDGIATMVSIVVLSFSIITSIDLGYVGLPLLLLSLGVVGSLGGFMIYNFHPSKIFMGDAGSQFLGVFLAIIGINSCWNVDVLGRHNGGYNVLLVLLVFILPLTDTTTVTINRLLKGSSPFVGGKDHTTHHLFFKGITEKRIALLFLVIGSISAYLAYSLIISYTFLALIFALSIIVITFFTLYLNTRIKKR